MIGNQVLQISEQPVQSCFRLGRYTELKLDLSRLFFCHKVGQIKVIENLSSLKSAVEDFSMVSVCIDRNEDERKVMKELVQRAKQQTNESTDKKYVVRVAYHPYIREMNKL